MDTDDGLEENCPAFRSGEGQKQVSRDSLEHSLKASIIKEKEKNTHIHRLDGMPIIRARVFV